MARSGAISGLLKERELSGTLRQLEVLAGLNRDADILLLEQGVFQEFFSAPLKFIFQKAVYPLAHIELDGAALATLVENWHQQGKRVHLLSSDEHTRVSRPTSCSFYPDIGSNSRLELWSPLMSGYPKDDGPEVWRANLRGPACRSCLTSHRSNAQHGFQLRLPDAGISLRSRRLLTAKPFAGLQGPRLWSFQN